MRNDSLFCWKKRQKKKTDFDFTRKDLEEIWTVEKLERFTDWLLRRASSQKKRKNMAEEK